MKFFLDECLKPQLRDLLIEAGHDAVHIVDRNLQGKTDDEFCPRPARRGVRC